MLAAVMAVALLPAVAVASTTMTATIDFEGLGEGTIVSAVSDGTGISGDPIAGSVGVVGTLPSVPGENRAMVFDSTCTPSATGDDADLCNPALGNSLIISEDGDSTDPDDADEFGMVVEFDFAGYGPTGTVDVSSITIVDVERVEPGGTIEAFGGGGSLGVVPIPTAGDNSTQVIPLDFQGVEGLVVTLAGSASVDNVEISVTEPDTPPGGGGDEGCTPGYWKQPQHLDSWEATGYSPDDSFVDVFGTNRYGDITLLEALELRGNRNGQALARHVVAGLLNSTSPDVDYFWTTAEVFAAFDAGLKDALAEANEAGCPLN